MDLCAGSLCAPRRGTVCCLLNSTRRFSAEGVREDRVKRGRLIAQTPWETKTKQTTTKKKNRCVWHFSDIFHSWRARLHYCDAEAAGDRVTSPGMLAHGIVRGLQYTRQQRSYKYAFSVKCDMPPHTYIHRQSDQWSMRQYTHLMCQGG